MKEESSVGSYEVKEKADLRTCSSCSPSFTLKCDYFTFYRQQMDFTVPEGRVSYEVQTQCETFVVFFLNFYVRHGGFSYNISTTKYCKSFRGVLSLKS